MRRSCTPPFFLSTCEASSSLTIKRTSAKMSNSSTWTKEETLKLIEFLGDSEIQAQLESFKRNQGVFEKITKELQEAGFDRTYQQCRKKIKKLRMEYQKVKDGRNKMGEDRN